MEACIRHDVGDLPYEDCNYVAFVPYPGSYKEVVASSSDHYNAASATLLRASGRDPMHESRLCLQRQGPPKHRRSWRRARSATFANDNCLPVQHGLNRNAGPFTAFSVSYYRTSSHTPRHHGPPAVATREHAPQVWPQATYKGTISIVVGCWKDFDRDKSERSQCAECTRRPDGSAASVGHKTQAQRM